MTGPQLLAKYFVNYLQPVFIPGWNDIAVLFGDLEVLVHLELSGRWTHRKVRDLLQKRVRAAQQIIKDIKIGKEKPFPFGLTWFQSKDMITERI